MNKFALLLLITLIIIISVLFYQFYPRRSYSPKNKSIFPISSEETPLSEEDSNYQYPTASIQSNLVTDEILNIYNHNQYETTPVEKEKIVLKQNIYNINQYKRTPIEKEQIVLKTNQLRTQFMPYLNYQPSSDKHLTTSNSCFSKEKDSCPLSSYKQCSNNYPLQDYNSFEICNCNVNKICPYQIKTPQDKPGIKLECPLVYNQEKKTLVIP